MGPHAVTDILGKEERDVGENGLVRSGIRRVIKFRDGSESSLLVSSQSSQTFKNMAPYFIIQVYLGRLQNITKNVSSQLQPFVLTLQFFLSRKRVCVSTA